MTVIIITIIIVAFSVIALGIGIFLKRGFPKTHIESNPAMRKLGIRCVKHDEILCQNKQINDEVCSSCQLINK